MDFQRKMCNNSLYEEAKNTIAGVLAPVFWDVKFEEVDIAKNPRFVLKRVIDRGDTRALKWIMERFTKEDIKELILTSRDVSRKTANFWTLILDIDPNKVPCLQKPYSRTPFGL